MVVILHYHILLPSTSMSRRKKERLSFFYYNTPEDDVFHFLPKRSFCGQIAMIFTVPRDKLISEGVQVLFFCF